MALAVPVITDLVGKSADGINNMDEAKRESAINTLALTSGFIPINPFLWPLHFGFFIVAVIILVMLTPLSWRFIFFLAYITQALIIASMVKSAANLTLAAASGL